MKIEILFPELCSLFGDHGNIIFLEETFGKENISYTSILDKPKFISEKIDLIYMGAMSEKTQLQVIDVLKPYKKELIVRIDQGMKALFTGNAMDILGSSIIEEDRTKIEALGIFEFKTVLKRNPRYNDTLLGKDSSGMEIIGHKTQFTQTFGNNELSYFIKTSIGKGINKESQYEGFVYRGLIATNMTGPLLTLNPDLAKKYLDTEVPFEAALMRAKKKKIEDIKKYHN